MKLTTSKTSANILPSRALMGNMAIVGSISLLSVFAGFCLTASASVLYVADAREASRINTISATGVVTPFVTGLPVNGPTGIAFDRDGYLYASIFFSNLINKISPDGKEVTVFASGLSGPYALAFASDGNLFVVNAVADTISKISSDGTVRPFETSRRLNDPVAIAFDGSGTMYVSERNESIPNSSTISKVSSTGVVTPFITGLGGAYGMIFDKSGNLLVADTYSGTVKKFAPDDGSTFTVFATATSVGVFGLALMTAVTCLARTI